MGLMLGLAIWASFADRRADTLIIIVTFAAVLTGALADGFAGWQFDLAPAIAALMMLTGLAGALRLGGGVVLLSVMGAAGGFASGASSGADGVTSSLLLFSLGGAIAAASAISYGLIGFRGITVSWSGTARRAGASWIAAIGLMSLALASSRYFGHR